MNTMGKTRFKLPPCSMNPWTEKLYSRHNWEIVLNKDTGLPRLDVEKYGDEPTDVVYYYHVVCSRPGCKVTNREKLRW